MAATGVLLWRGGFLFLHFGESGGRLVSIVNMGVA